MGLKVLVIPSNREGCLKRFFDVWEGRGGWDRVIVVEDNPIPTFNVMEMGKDEYAYHYSWKEIDEILGQNSWIISHRDSAIRCFGFLEAYKMGAEYVLTLDDDCYPDPVGYEEGTLFDEHIFRMNGYSKWMASVPGCCTRGTPYKNVGDLNTVVASMGYWKGVPDLDAVASLAKDEDDKITFPSYSFLLPHGVYAPICGMNLCIRRKAIPLFYFPLMGMGQPYARFDDIWAGVIAKKLCDHLGWYISVGGAYINHKRASDPFDNLVKEAPGIRANEWFWQVIDNIELDKDVSGCLTNIQLLGEALQEEAKNATNPEYIEKLGKCLAAWVSCFRWADAGHSGPVGTVDAVDDVL